MDLVSSSERFLLAGVRGRLLEIGFCWNVLGLVARERFLWECPGAGCWGSKPQGPTQAQRENAFLLKCPGGLVAGGRFGEPVPVAGCWGPSRDWFRVLIPGACYCE